VERQVDGDLERFKKLIEDQGYASGAWRGDINEGVGVGTPGVENIATSQGDSGKAVKSSGASETPTAPQEAVTPVPPVESATVVVRPCRPSSPSHR
jgi:hypothetical protein